MTIRKTIIDENRSREIIEILQFLVSQFSRPMESRSITIVPDNDQNHISLMTDPYGHDPGD